MPTPSKPQLDRRYELDDRIAAGGYGEVWQATDLLLGRPVAVKLLLAQHVQQPQTLARFRAEAQRAGALTHRNIARVYDYVEPRPPQPPFLVMELISGPSLAQVLEGGPLPPAQVMDILAGAASGLQAAHDAGLVHRDIKPANLLLSRDGTVKITDFGISYAADSAPMTASGMLLGTAGYLAPERLGGGPVTGAADLYALGVVGYECLAGGPPFTGTPLEIAVAHRDRALPPLPGSVPAGVASLIDGLTAKNPAGRPASAGEVARWAADQHDWLVGATRADYAPGLTAPATMLAPAAAAPWEATGPAGPPGGPPRRRAALFAGLAAVAVVAAVAVGLVLTRSGGSPAPRQAVQGTGTPSATGLATAGGGGPTHATGATAPAGRTAPTTAPARRHPPTTAPARGTAPTTAPAGGTAPTTAPATAPAPSAPATSPAGPPPPSHAGPAAAKVKAKAKPTQPPPPGP